MKMNQFIYVVLLVICCTSCTHKSESGNSTQNNNNETLIEDRNYSSTIPALDNDTILSGFVSDTNNEKTYYPSGQLHFVYKYEEDKSHFSFKEYYSNGNLKQSGQQGVFAGCGIQVGTELNYDSDGNLLSKRIFENFLPEDAIGCHDTRIVISITEFYSDGNIKAEKQIETGYEADECSCGEWNFYNTEGDLTESQNYENCYDLIPNCLMLD